MTTALTATSTPADTREIGNYRIAVGQEALLGSPITMTPQGRIFDGFHRATALMQMTGAIPESLIRWVDEQGRPTAAPWEQ